MIPPRPQNQSRNITVRPAAYTDAATMIDFNIRLAQETEDKNLDLPTITRGVHRALRSTEMCRYYIAEVDHRVVGQTMITYELSDWRDGLIWWIQSVYVHPEFRGAGVFTKLYQTIMRDAATSGDARCLRLYVEVQNTRAMTTYYRLGMTDAGYKVLEAPVTPS